MKHLSWYDYEEGVKRMPGQKIEPTTENLEASLRENFKLSSYEARTYLTLLRLGLLNPKQISAKANVPMPRIYDTLDSLMEKGFIMKRDDSFLAVSPRRALHGRSAQFETQFALEQKQRKLAEEQLGKVLESGNQRREKSEEGEISILKGFNSIANTFSDLLEKSHEVFLLAKRAVDAKDVFIPILLEYARNNLPKKIRIIVPRDVKIDQEDISKARRVGIEIRKTDRVLFDMMATDLDDVIIGVPDPQSEEINHAIAIWVRNSSFSKSTRSSIEEIWNSAKAV